ncbi:MAG: 7,8-dihydro-6-hydroxymethylpterin-pyrophosphokinase, partial [Prevotella sp.]|nr:7,8-dihydro-6-hydroxymethylpterin-pyrophosphokinase [Prevotella sp.]
CIEMDIDVLEYGGERLHEGDWQRSYVAELLTELHSK